MRKKKKTIHINTERTQKVNGEKGTHTHTRTHQTSTDEQKQFRKKIINVLEI